MFLCTFTFFYHFLSRLPSVVDARVPVLLPPSALTRLCRQSKSRRDFNRDGEPSSVKSVASRFSEQERSKYIDVSLG